MLPHDEYDPRVVPVVSDEQLQQIRERREKLTTQGPYGKEYAGIHVGWNVYGHEVFPGKTEPEPSYLVVEGLFDEADADFFVNAPTDIDALLAEVERLQSLIKILQSAIPT